MWLFLGHQKEPSTYHFTLPYINLNSNFFITANNHSNINKECDSARVIICCGNVEILEVYHVAKGMPLRQSLWGVWNANVGLTSTEMVKWDRRLDLSGLHLVGVAEPVSIVDIVICK